MLMELGRRQRRIGREVEGAGSRRNEGRRDARIGRTAGEGLTHPAVQIISAGTARAERGSTHDGDLAAEVVLDLALLDGVGRLLLDDGEELLDAHAACVRGPSPQSMMGVIGTADRTGGGLIAQAREQEACSGGGVGNPAWYDSKGVLCSP